MRPLLLLTRPDPQAQRFAQLAAGVCPAHDLLIAPLSKVVAVPFEASVLEGAKGLVLTSANAVPMVAELCQPGLPAWCVGPATAKAARAAGFTVYEGGGDAATLIDVLVKARPAGPLIHPHGVHVARDLAAALRPTGVDLRSVAVYEAQGLDWPQATRNAVIAAPWVIAPLFSPRTAQRIVQQLEGVCPDGLRLVAISEACAARLPETFRACTTIAQTPDSQGMLRGLAAEMSQNSKDGLRQARPVDK